MRRELHCDCDQAHENSGGLPGMGGGVKGGVRKEQGTSSLGYCDRLDA